MPMYLRLLIGQRSEVVVKLIREQEIGLWNRIRLRTEYYCTSKLFQVVEAVYMYSYNFAYGRQ